MDQQQIAPKDARRLGPTARWLREIDRELTVRAQFLVSGNVRDIYPLWTERGLAFRPGVDCLWAMMVSRGLQAALVHDPVDGSRLMTDGRPETIAALESAGLDAPALARPGLAALAKRIALAAGNTVPPMAVILPQAARLIGDPGRLTEEERLFLAAIAKLAVQPRPRQMSVDGLPPRNPVIWLLDRPSDLPEWLGHGTPEIRPVTAGLPDLDDRHLLARALVARLPAGEPGGPGQAAIAQSFAIETEGMQLRALSAVSDLARSQKMAADRLSDALRAFRTGISEDPWANPVLRRQIAIGEEKIRERVKGQTTPIRRAIDILMRAAVGLSGAQASARRGRPRGVMFLAGPTGTGKTELAKAITELLFGDESAYHRFDMSEFADERSEGRLIGAPPGQPGHENGGELIEAARSRPFAVFLFDEIEKAHPSILDKFLQILDEGRLTGGRGETVYFSEALIIFTSNLGMFAKDENGMRRQVVLPCDSYEEMQHKMTQAIVQTFRNEMQRPELISRMGDNIIVFDFIRLEVGRRIAESMTRKVLKMAKETTGYDVVLEEEVQERLTARCTQELWEGGRGVGNMVEAHLVNPLARLLFRLPMGGGSLTITDLVEGEKETELKGITGDGTEVG